LTATPVSQSIFLAIRNKLLLSLSLENFLGGALPKLQHSLAKHMKSIVHQRDSFSVINISHQINAKVLVG